MGRSLPAEHMQFLYMRRPNGLGSIPFTANRSRDRVVFQQWSSESFSGCRHSPCAVVKLVRELGSRDSHVARVDDHDVDRKGLDAAIIRLVFALQSSCAISEPIGPEFCCRVDEEPSPRVSSGLENTVYMKILQRFRSLTKGAKV